MTEFEAFAAAEREGWSDPERVAAYTALFAKGSDQIIPAIVEACRPGPGTKALDLCCGHGNLTEALSDAGAEVTGLDFSPAMLAAARARVPGAAFVEGDAQAMPFADGSFDVVVSNVGLGHVPDQPKAVAEIARVLKPGGVAALSSWSAPEDSPSFQVVFGALKAKADDLSAAPSAPDFHALARPETAEPLLGKAGFRDLRLKTVNVVWEFDRPEGFAEVFRRATVRAAMMVGSQSAQSQSAIWQAMTETVADRFGDGSGRWRVPFPAVLATAVRG